MTALSPVRAVVLHCSASAWGSAAVIDGWHRERGFTGIGYHWVICNGRTHSAKKFDELWDGAIEQGRPESVAGSHAQGRNHDTIGVCMIGDAAFTPRQLEVTANLLGAIMISHKIPILRLLGHYEVPSGARQGKTCPNYPMDVMRSVVSERMISGIDPEVAGIYALAREVRP